MEIQTEIQIRAKQRELVAIEKEHAKRTTEYNQVQLGVQEKREEMATIQLHISILSAHRNSLLEQVARDEISANVASTKIDQMEAKAIAIVKAVTQK